MNEPLENTHVSNYQHRVATNRAQSLKMNKEMNIFYAL